MKPGKRRAIYKVQTSVTLYARKHGMLVEYECMPVTRGEIGRAEESTHLMRKVNSEYASWWAVS